MVQNNEENSWHEWSMYVLKELERLNEEVTKLRDGTQKRMMRISNEVAALKVKSGIWGALGGLIPIVVILAIWFVTNHVDK